jgi:hypothetical protein
LASAPQARWSTDTEHEALVTLQRMLDLPGTATSKD